MASLTEVRTAFKTVLEAALTSPQISVHRTIDSVVNVPAVVVRPGTSDFDLAMGRGTDAWLFDLIVLVSRSTDVLAQDQLDAYIDGGGTKSIRKIIFNNKTLGLTDVDAHVTGMHGYGAEWDAGSNKYVGAALRCSVYLKPS